jgi:hypothetical protein
MKEETKKEIISGKNDLSKWSDTKTILIQNGYSIMVDKSNTNIKTKNLNEIINMLVFSVLNEPRFFDSCKNEQQKNEIINALKIKAESIARNVIEKKNEEERKELEFKNTLKQQSELNKRNLKEQEMKFDKMMQDKERRIKDIEDQALSPYGFYHDQENNDLCIVNCNRNIRLDKSCGSNCPSVERYNYTEKGKNYCLGNCPSSAPFYYTNTNSNPIKCLANFEDKDFYISNTKECKKSCGSSRSLIDLKTSTFICDTSLNEGENCPADFPYEYGSSCLTLYIYIISNLYSIILIIL